MYDFVKIEINDSDFVTGLLNNDLLDFSIQLNKRTGEMGDIQKAVYKNLKFSIHPSNRVEIAGSLHHYWNDGLHNYNDYPISAVADTLIDLHQKFNINLTTARLHNEEFGLNIITPFNPKVAIKNLIAYKSKPFNQTENIAEGNFYFAKGSNQYFIKIYNKGYHFKQPENILRFEKKVKKMECIRKEPIYLSDLIDPHFVQKSVLELIRCFNDIIITEKINLDFLSTTQKRVFNLCNNPRNWEAMTPKQRFYNKASFKDILKAHGTQQLHSTIRDLLIKKGNDLTDFQNIKRERFDSSYIRSNHSFSIIKLELEKRACQSCGKDITHQDKKSKFCSAKYVGYEQAHQCRNAVSNPKNNIIRKIEGINSKGVLFPIEPYLKISNYHLLPIT